MKERMLLIAIVLLVLLLTPACQSSGTEESGEANDARTYYESLNLETSEDAVQTFVQAFQRRDFMTVYLVLDAKAQRLAQVENGQTFSWRHLIQEDIAEGLRHNLDYQEIINRQTDFWYFFDQIMLYAVEKDGLLIDLRGDLEILRSEDAQTRDGEPAVDVIANVDGVNGEVLFRMATDRDGHWRVYLVSAPGQGVDSWPSTVLIENPE